MTLGLLGTHGIQVEHLLKRAARDRQPFDLKILPHAIMFADAFNLPNLSVERLDFPPLRAILELAWEMPHFNGQRAAVPMTEDA